MRADHSDLRSLSLAAVRVAAVAVGVSGSRISELARGVSRAARGIPDSASPATVAVVLIVEFSLASTTQLAAAPRFLESIQLATASQSIDQSQQHVAIQ